MLSLTTDLVPKLGYTAVAREMYAQSPAVLVLEPDDYAQLRTG